MLIKAYTSLWVIDVDGLLRDLYRSGVSVGRPAVLTIDTLNSVALVDPTVWRRP